MRDETSTGPEVDNAHFNKPMKDVAEAIEAKLYGSEEEPVEAEFEEVSEDADLPVEDDELPEDDETDDEEDEAEDDLEDIAEGDELSLADYLGIEDDRISETDDGLVFNAIIDGEAKQVPLKDLVADYQLKSHVNNKSIALENERKEFAETRDKVATELKTRLEGVTQLTEMAEQELVSDYNAIDWARLRTEDPANWTALRQEYAEKAQKIQDTKRLVGEESQRIDAERQEEMQGKMKEHLQGEYNALVAKNPEWADKAVMEKSLGELQTFVASAYGYNAQEFENISDHRLIEVLKDARAFREGTKGAEAKKVKRVPKFTKPGAARGNAATLAKARNVKAQKDKVKKSGGNVRAVADLLVDRM